MGITRNKLYFHYYKNKFKSILFNPKLILFYIERFKKYSNAQTYDLLLVSYPKSGRTWVQNIFVELGKLNTKDLITEKTSISDALALLATNDDWSFPEILATHDKSSWEQVEPLHDKDEIQKVDFEDFEKSKVIFLYRDPRDVLVSQYYHLVLRNKIKNVTKDDLVDNDIFGIEKIIHFMNKWNKYSSQNPERVICISYEDLKNKSVETLSRITKFMELKVEQSDIASAIENSNIKSMQKKQSSKSNNDPWTKTDDVKNKNSFQSRKGLIGEHKEFFDKDQQARMNTAIANLLDSNFDYFS